MQGIDDWSQGTGKEIGLSRMADMTRYSLTGWMGRYKSTGYKSVNCGVASDLRCPFQGATLLQGWLVAFSKRTLLVSAAGHDGMAGPPHRTRLSRYRLPDGLKRHKTSDS
ncbi:MAG: hypothetical protein IKP37_04770 [Paludibacteraceae bacterium]|nr:hypothetical protein [Paludibacteraceae bacterium]